MTFDEAFDILIGHEGGYVNHPNDPGGETRFGISKRAYPLLDIKVLTLDQAKAIYRRDYWIPAGCDRVPEALRFDVLDMAVNSGVKVAIQTLQRALGVRDDGLIGPAKMPPAIIKRLADEAGKAAKSKETQAAFAGDSTEEVGSTAQEFADFIKKEQGRWSQVVKAAGIKAD